VAKGELQSMPFFRTFLRKLGHFAFNREDPRARLQQAEEIEQALRRGESVFVFPEGTFTAQAGVRGFQLGAFKAALAAGRPVMPVALNGTRRALRDGAWLPRPVQITVTICRRCSAIRCLRLARNRSHSRRRPKQSPGTRRTPALISIFSAATAEQNQRIPEFVGGGI